MLAADWDRMARELILEVTRLQDEPNPVRVAVLSAVLAAAAHLMESAPDEDLTVPAADPALDPREDADLATVVALMREQAVRDEQWALPHNWRPA